MIIRKVIQHWGGPIKDLQIKDPRVKIQEKKFSKKWRKHALTPQLK